MRRCAEPSARVTSLLRFHEWPWPWLLGRRLSDESDGDPALPVRNDKLLSPSRKVFPEPGWPSSTGGSTSSGVKLAATELQQQTVTGEHRRASSRIAGEYAGKAPQLSFAERDLKRFVVHRRLFFLAMARPYHPWLCCTHVLSQLALTEQPRRPV